MRIKKIQLLKFKRFDDLTINLGDNPKKIIAMVGPNGCGKSSVFDAFEEKLKDYFSPPGQNSEDVSFFSKSFHYSDTSIREEVYHKAKSIKITNDLNNEEFSNKSFHIRTSYRFAAKLDVKKIEAKDDELKSKRPISSIAIDNRFIENYERLLGKAFEEFESGDKTGTLVKKELIGRVNEILSKILDIKISSIGNVMQKKGSLFFEKENTIDFPYANLSSGEKEVIDIIIDLVVKTKKFNDTIFCIDEPELHLNTKIQRSLLNEIEKLIPENCQLWIATHSIGLLRALQEELKDKSQILDFGEKDYFQGAHTIIPIIPNRKNWQRIFQTALEDLTYLLSPKRIIYCEGKPNPGENNKEEGLDANVLNNIFGEEFPDSLFVSSGGSDVLKNANLALSIINKAFPTVELLRLKDKDENNDLGRDNFLKEDRSNRMLKRRDLENYLFDKELLRNYCDANSIDFKENEYDALIKDINNMDLKPIQPKLKIFISYTDNIEKLKVELSKYIKKELLIYNELKESIF